MNIRGTGDGFLHESNIMKLILDYRSQYNKKSFTDEKYFLLSREKEFSKGYCHSIIYGIK